MHDSTMKVRCGSDSEEDHVVPHITDVVLEHRDTDLPKALISYPMYIGSAYILGLALLLKLPGVYWRPPPTMQDGTISFTFLQLSHAASAVGFGVAQGITFVSVWWKRNLVKRKVGICVIYVNSISFLTYAFFMLYGTPSILVKRSNGTEVVEPARYFQWLFTTPAIIYTVSSMLRRSADIDLTRGYALLSDMVMILTGFLERYFESPLHEIFFMVSMVSYFFTMLHFKTLANMGADALVEEADRKKFHRIHTYTVVVWTLFPVVRILSMMGISYELEEFLNTVLDVAAKLVYVVCIMVIKFTVVDELLEKRLVKAEEYVRSDVAREASRDRSALECVEDFHTRKLLAYREADAWRRVRVQSLRNEGYPAGQAEALLEATLKEYVALSSGDISSFLTFQRGGSIDSQAPRFDRHSSIDDSVSHLG